MHHLWLCLENQCSSTEGKKSQCLFSKKKITIGFNEGTVFPGERWRRLSAYVYPNPDRPPDMCCALVTACHSERAPAWVTKILERGGGGRRNQERGKKSSFHPRQSLMMRRDSRLNLCGPRARKIPGRLKRRKSDCATRLHAVEVKSFGSRKWDQQLDEE